MNSKILALLEGKEEKSKGKTTIETVRADPLTEVQVSAYTHDKAFSYARLACEIHGSTIECGGYLVSPKGTPGRIAQDAYLAHGQVVGAGDYKLTAQDVIAAGRHLNEAGMKILGWWHSHGTLSTFHSGIDVDNQMTVLNAISPFNFIYQDRSMSLEGLTSIIEGDNLVSFDPANPGTRFEMPLSELKRPSLSKIRMRVRQQIGFAYSFVVNDQGKQSYPYAEIATRVFNPTDNSFTDKSEHVDLHVYPSLETSVNEDQLEEEILERVRVRRSIFYSLGNILEGAFGAGEPTPVQGLKRRKGAKKIKYDSREEIVPIGKTLPVQSKNLVQQTPEILTSILGTIKSKSPSMLEQFAEDPSDQRPIVVKKREPYRFTGNWGNREYQLGDNWVDESIPNSKPTVSWQSSIPKPSTQSYYDIMEKNKEKGNGGPTIGVND